MKKVNYTFLRSLLSLVLPLFLFAVEGYGQGWQWSAYGAGSQNSISQAVATDRFGNKFVAGSYSGDTLIVNGIVLANAGDQNAFIVKYNVTGNVMWAKRFGGMYSDGATALATDTLGNVYITGYFTSAQIRFDSILIGNYYQNLVEGGESTADGFIAKIDSTGHSVWAKDIGGLGSEMINSVCVGPFGDVTVCGTFNSDSLVLGPDTLISAGAYDIFVLRYNSAGTLQWHAHAGGTHNDGAYSVTTDTAGNLYLAGNFASPSLSFGSIVLNNAFYVNHVFLAKYSRAGVVQWAVSAGADKDALATSVVCDPGGNSYLAGTFSSSSFSFGPDTLRNSSGFGNMFLVKFGPSGGLLWQKGAAPNDNVFPQSLVYDTSGFLYGAGFFSSTTATLGTTTITNSDVSGYADVFLAKYDNGGTVHWVATAGGPLDDVIYGLAEDNSGNLIVSGFFSGTDFYLNYLDDTSTQNTDFFIARFNEQKMAVPENTKAAPSVSVYPLPAEGEIVVKAASGTIGNVQIINTLGQTVYSENKGCTVNICHINTSAFAPGTYTLATTTGDGRTTHTGIVISSH